jgi:chromosome segregation ATPase
MDDPNNTVRDHTLEYLRYIRQAVDDLKGEMAGIKLRQTSVEQALLGLRSDVVRLEESIFRQTVRIDAMDGKLDRIAARPDRRGLTQE